MDAEGIREIARMQSEIDAYSMGVSYILMQLHSRNKEHIFPELDIPEIDMALNMIKKLQKESQINERGKD